MDSESPEVLCVLKVLTVKTNECKEAFSSVCIGNCLNGLQGMTSENAIVIEMLRALVLKVAKSPDVLTSQCVGSALMGVRRMNTLTTEVKTLLAILALKINDSTLVLDPISFSMALNGLRSMDESSVEMRALLGTLGDKINSMRETLLTPNVLSNALSGFRKLSGENPESRLVLHAILNKMGAAESTTVLGTARPIPMQFNSIEIGRALYGLQSMSAETCPDVLPMLKRLAVSVYTSKGPLYARDAGLALYGLKSHSEDYPDVKQVIAAITARLSLSVDIMNAKSVSMAMMGLQGLTSDSKEVCELLSLLSSRIGDLDSQACGNILYSMKKMNSQKSEVRGFLKALVPKIEACEGVMSSQELANAFYGERGQCDRVLLFTLRGFAYFLLASTKRTNFFSLPSFAHMWKFYLLCLPRFLRPSGLQGMDSTHAETRNLLRVLTQKLLESKDSTFTSQG